jgi:NarL family two-component system sensor histidine kinase LiaS
MTKINITKSKQKLRWKLTLSYTGVTVGVLLAAELALYIAAVSGLALLLKTGYLPSEMINLVSGHYALEMQHYLSESPRELKEIAFFLEHIRPGPNTLGFSLQETDGLLMVGGDGELLAVSPPDYLEKVEIGQPLDPEALPGLSDPLQAALAGEKDIKHLYTLENSDNNVVMAVPIWDSTKQDVLGVLVMSIAAPTVNSIIGDLLPTLGVSLLFFTLVAALVGTAFGYVAARGLVQRLDRLANATEAWSQGDFDVYVDDIAGDELGQLAQRLNKMAQQLEQLLEARRELVVVEERNRLARDLHDSVKQQAFATAGQISAARRLIGHNPEEAESHIEEAEKLISDLRKELTNLIQELRPIALDGKGLASALRSYAEDWSRQNDITLDVHIQQEQALPLEIEQGIFRILQEAFSNIARHSEANHAEVVLIYNPIEISCVISDNGLGFNLEPKSRGFGLRSMDERAIALGGKLICKSQPGKGTQIKLAVPIPNGLENVENQSHD